VRNKNTDYKRLAIHPTLRRVVREFVLREVATKGKSATAHVALKRSFALGSVSVQNVKFETRRATKTLWAYLAVVGELAGVQEYVTLEAGHLRELGATFCTLVRSEE